MPVLEGKDEKRFLSKIPNYLPRNECWPWLGTRNKSRRNYGLFKLKGKLYSATRLVIEYISLQPISKGIYVLHSCDNPICVNPAHLFLGTAQDNVDDMKRKGRANYAFGERCAVKLTDKQVKEIREATETHKNIALKYGVHQSTITRIKNYKRRKKYVTS